MSSRRLPLPAVMLLLIGCNGMPVRPDRPLRQGFPIKPQTFDLGRVNVGVDVFAPVGNIHVVEGETAAFEKTITVSADSRGEAEDIAARCEVVIGTGENGRTLIEFAGPADMPVERVGADTQVRIPRRLDLSLRTNSGLIDTTSYVGGRGELETRNGTILAGPFRELRFKSRSGRVELTGGFEQVTGFSDSADLLVRAPPPGSRLEFHSTTGTCTLLVPPDVALDVRYRTSKGELSYDIPTIEPVESTGGGTRWHERRLRLFGLGQACQIFVESERGDLVIRRTQRREP